MTKVAYRVVCTECGDIATYDEDFDQIDGPEMQEGNYEVFCEGECETQYALELLGARGISEIRIESRPV